MAKYFHQAPALVNATHLNKDWGCAREITVLGRSVWVPARPLGYESLFSRFKLAYMVFRGKADALVWDQQ